MKKNSTKNIELKEKQTLKVKLPNGETAYLKFGTKYLDVEIVTEGGYIGAEDQKTIVELQSNRVHLTRMVNYVSGYCELEAPEWDSLTKVAKVKK